jgi:hypothetical protein
MSLNKKSNEKNISTQESEQRQRHLWLERNQTADIDIVMKNYLS